MTLEQKKLIACAELAGFTNLSCRDYGRIVIFGCNGSKATFEIPDYGTSLDAIVPVVVKWCGKDNDNWNSFFLHLFKKRYDSATLAVLDYIKKKPSQIRDALLLAAGKMPEGDGK